MLVAAGVPAAPWVIGETGQAVPAVASRLPPRLSSLKGCSSARGEATAAGAASNTFCDTASAPARAVPVCSPSRLQGFVAALDRALHVPFHWYLLAAWLSFAAEPTFL